MDALTPLVVTPTVEHADTPDVRALLLRHVELMRELSPEESCHVMVPDTLVEAGVTLLGMRRDGKLLAVGALASIGPQAGELKSMHTAADARGQGMARQLVRALISHAKQLGMINISLETGTDTAFAAARALYVSEGFTVCAPFGSYTSDPLSVFMTRAI